MATPKLNNETTVTYRSLEDIGHTTTLSTGNALLAGADDLFTDESVAHEKAIGDQRAHGVERRDATETRLNAARSFISERAQAAKKVASLLMEAQRPAVSLLLESDTWQMTGAHVYSDAVSLMDQMLKPVGKAAALKKTLDEHAAFYIGTPSVGMKTPEKLAHVLAIASEVLQRTAEQTQQHDYKASNAVASVERYVMQFALARAAEAEYLPQLQAIYGIDFDVKVITRKVPGRKKDEPVDCVRLAKPEFSWGAAMNVAFIELWEVRQKTRTIDELSPQARRMMEAEERETGNVVPVHMRGADAPSGEVSGLAADLEAQQ